MSEAAVARAVDDLYQRAVEDPYGIDDTALEEWMVEAGDRLGGVVDKPTMKILRRVLRDARKLAAYWTAHDASPLPDWHLGVDEALGSRGWEPQLDLVEKALADNPSRDLFEDMRLRYRAVHFQPWMEGVSYEEWEAGG